MKAERWYGCPLCGRCARTSRELTTQGCEGKHVELMPVEEAEIAQEFLTLQLGECYRLSGADPDGANDAHLAKHAVEAVRTLREESDANNLEELELREKAEQRARRLELALQRLQAGPDTLTPDGLIIVLEALYSEAASCD